MRNALWIALVSALAFAGGVALGAVGIPTQYLPSPIGTEAINVVPASGQSPEIVSVQLTQLRDSAAYVKLVPTTGTTYTPTTNVSVIQATPAGALSAWTVVTPPKPVDGQRLQIFSTQAITTFNLTAATGQTVNGNLAGSLGANGNVEYVYSTSNTTWDRIQ